MKKFPKESNPKYIQNQTDLFGDPELWAKSTLTPSDDMELINIFTMKIGTGMKGSFSTPQETIRQRIWLHEVLDDNKIPYYVEFVTNLSGRRRVTRTEIQNVYVEKKHVKKAKQLIKEFKKPATDEELYDETITYTMKDGITQIPCPHCDKEIDFDVPKCPFCKMRL